MQDKICVITGATDGIGKEAALALAARGARLLIHGRDADKGAAVVEAIKAHTRHSSVEFLPADFASLSQVRRLAAEILKRTSHIDVLINNAGGMFVRRGLSQDGYERTFAVNHLAPFLLTHLLQDALKAAAPSRIITTASAAHRGVKLDFDDLQAQHRYSALGAYGRSKLANILFTRSLARRLAGTGVTATCLHPGLVRTGIARDMAIIPRGLFKLFAWMGRSPQKGAETLVYLASAAAVEGASGGYYIDCQAAQPTAEGQDDAAAEKLWRVSEQLVGLA